MPCHLVAEARFTGFVFSLPAGEYLDLPYGQHYVSHLNVQELGKLKYNCIVFI